jgi:ubiquinone biosynthesis UbiH/UbiF/VisC/COQ6 family hydroxylase
VFALSPAARSLLEAIGVWQHLDPGRIAPVYDMRIVNASGQALPEVHLDAYRARIEALAWIVENRELQAALHRALARAVGDGAITEVFATVTGLQLPSHGWSRSEPVQVVLDGGRGLDAGLVVAADGIDSAVREMAGIDARPIDHRQTAIVANFETERPTRDVAWQWFSAAGITALLPLPPPVPTVGETEGEWRGRVSLVWSVPDAQLEAARARPLTESIAAITAGRLGRMRQISAARSFPLRSIRTRTVLAPGVVVIGDAAHAVHPMAGQGMNLGFGDVSALAAALGSPTVPAPGVVAEPAGGYLALRRYERARAEAVFTMQAGLAALERLFAPPPAALPPPLAGLRDLGWRMVARSPWLRRRMVRQAAG